MKRLIFIAIWVSILAVVTQSADAQVRFRLGGGVIVDGTVLGGGVALDVPMVAKSYDISISGEYYTKSGNTTAPIRGVVTFTRPFGRHDFYFGLGTGILYTKVGGTIPVSKTKPLGTGVAGVNLQLSDDMGFYAEASLDRALSSGVKSNTALRIGFSFGGN